MYTNLGVWMNVDERTIVLIFYPFLLLGGCSKVQYAAE